MGLVLLSILSALVSLRYSKINTDFTTLIHPQVERSWYRHNEKYKRAFPEVLQTAIVVVSGANSRAVDKTATRLVNAFREQEAFEFVFAPSLDEFLISRKLYFLSEENLDLWIKGVEYNYGALLRLADGAGMVNLVYILADQISSVQGLPIPEPLASLAEGFETSSNDKHTSSLVLRAYPRLIDETQETFYQIIVIKGEQHYDRSLPNKAVVESISNIISAVKESAAIDTGVIVRLTGEVALANEELDAGLSGVGIAGVISLLLLALILGLGIRSKRIIGITFAMLLMGVILTTALATLTVGSYNVLSLMFVVMFFGLGVDFAVHFALRVREAANTGEIADACTTAISDIGPALLLCMITSMVAFLSFLPTAYRGMAELGVISAGGMLIAFILSITLLPALFSIYGVPQQGDKKLPAFELKLKPSHVLVSVTLLSLVAIYYAKEIRFDYSVLAMRDASTEAMTTLLELQDKKITTDYSISILVADAGEAEALKQQLQHLSVVGDVAIPSDFLPKGQQAKSKKLQALLELYESIEEVLPGQTNEGLADALQYLVQAPSTVREADQHLVQNIKTGLTTYLTDEQALTRLNQELFKALNSELEELRLMLAAKPFAMEDIADDLRSRLITPAGEHLVTVQPAKPLNTRRLTEEFITEVERVAPNIAGRSVVEWGVGDVVVESFLFAGSLSLLCITVLLLFYFRNIVLPMLVLVPIMLSLLFTFAICHIAGITLNMANILVIPLIIGLGVDTGIHVVHRFTLSEGVESVYTSSTARAVLISGLTTAGTFFSLSFSPHKGAASVGLLLTIAISLLIIATFIVLPALLRVIRYGEPSSSLPRV